LPDIVDTLTRSRMMSGIQGKNTKPEMLVRRALHALGYRYRIHTSNVPGRPDFVLPRYRAAIFVNGCFWHGHDCALFRLPDTRREFWSKKIEGNVKRDALVREQVISKGWRYLAVWECAIRGKHQIGLEQTTERIVRWLRSSATSAEVRGSR
jgi:DNA mismatch endonuclease (patch repair protein)